MKLSSMFYIVLHRKFHVDIVTQTGFIKENVTNFFFENNKEFCEIACVLENQNKVLIFQIIILTSTHPWLKLYLRTSKYFVGVALSDASILHLSFCGLQGRL